MCRACRKVFCRTCNRTMVEDTGVFAPCSRVTRRLARFVHDLCKVMTVTDVAAHAGLDWKTVRNIDKEFLEKEYGTPDYNGLRILAVDEIAIRNCFFHIHGLPSQFGGFNTPSIYHVSLDRSPLETPMGLVLPLPT